MKRLKKQLTLFDVYAISTGAMFSSGFFLLPGIAAGHAGPAVVLAYLLAALLVAPAMLSKAELCSAMPRAGGTYYFLDRTLGPIVGTIGGFGTWLALILKSAFALIGMGAYLSLFVHVPIRSLAIGLTVVFMLLNLFGAKETTGLQRGLVVTLLVILTLFVVQGLVHAFSGGAGGGVAQKFSPFLPFGADGLASTIGLVFISYGGLIKVASIPEEVKDPDHNIPRGMFLSLLTAAVVYVLGVFVMVAVLDPAELASSLTPVAAAGQRVFTWLPGSTGLILIVAAAIAAFSAMANAGIMTASRYPLAMARDRMIWRGFSRLGRRGTPTHGILATAAIMIVCLAFLDVVKVAKLAASLQLLVFGLENLAVIVMRESRIESYDPGFRSPLYPWVQFIGFLVPLWLITEMGWLPSMFTLGLITAAVAWYTYYARGHVVREGAVYHVFERLGRRRFEGLDSELRQILKEKGLRAEDPFDEVVATAHVIDRADPVSFEEITAEASRLLAADLPIESAVLAAKFLEGTRVGATPVGHGVALPHARFEAVAAPRLVLVRAPGGVHMDPELAGGPDRGDVRAVFFLVSPAADPGRHLRILAQLAQRADDEAFLDEWLAAANEQELKEAVLGNERYLCLSLRADTPSASLIGRALRDADMPAGSLVALVRRGGAVLVPSGATVLRDGDRLTVLGEPDVIEGLRARFTEGPANV
ncbi:MAG: amino acid permease [Gemmatimonadota bacterium]